MQQHMKLKYSLASLDAIARLGEKHKPAKKTKKHFNQLRPANQLRLLLYKVFFVFVFSAGICATIYICGIVLLFFFNKDS